MYDWQLHPVSGPGEDRNVIGCVFVYWLIKGCTRSPDRVQDRNWGRRRAGRWWQWLHPVSGPGEDRNLAAVSTDVASGECCTRSPDRVRIATPLVVGTGADLLGAAPGLRTG